MEENQSNQDIEFIKEKVKERPLNKKKLIKRTLLTASMAVIFGLIACLTFLVLEPVFTNLLYPEEEPRPVQLREEDIEDEMLPEDMILTEAADGVGTEAVQSGTAGVGNDRGGAAQGPGRQEGQGPDAAQSETEGDGNEAGAGTGSADEAEAGRGTGETGNAGGAGSADGTGEAGDAADAGGAGNAGSTGGEAENTGGAGNAGGTAGGAGNSTASGGTGMGALSGEPETVEKVELEMSDYQRLYRLMYALVQRNNQSMVTVTGVVTDMDWFDNIYENQGQASGLIVADNGVELLILTDNTVVEDAESLLVTFQDDVQTSAQIKGQDAQTGLAIISVVMEEIPEETRENLTMAVLGSSGSSLLATPVIAVGRPLGSATSLIYGMVTSSDSRASFVDHNVRLLTTDMMGTENSSGVLINLSGQVIGILRPMSLRRENEAELLTAYGVADLRLLIEKMSNGAAVPRMGVTGSDVPVEIHTEMDVPLGAYVTNIQMDSPAMKAGIQSGDVIVELNGTELRSFSEYQETLMNLEPGMSVPVTVMRQGAEEYQEMTVDVILEEAK